MKALLPSQVPDYVRPYIGKQETRANGSIWRAAVYDMGRHYSVIWSLVAYPWNGTLVTGPVDGF